MIRARPVKASPAERQSPSPAGRCRRRLTTPCRRLVSRRLTFDPRVGLVFVRGFGFSAARRTSSTSRPTASWRFATWVRCRLAWMMSTPSSVMRFRARDIRRCRTSSGREGEWATSKRSWTAVDTLFTFWPPGPEERMNSSSNSRSSIEIVGVTWIMTNTKLQNPSPKKRPFQGRVPQGEARFREDLIHAGWRPSARPPLPALSGRHCGWKRGAWPAPMPRADRPPGPEAPRNARRHG